MCEPPEWKEEKKVKTTHTHIRRGEKKTIQNQVIKLFMKLYEKKNERKEGKSEAQAPIDENE